MGPKPRCYKCDKTESCEKYNQYTACSECYDDELCLPGKVITDPVTKQSGRCVICMKPRIIKATYRLHYDPVRGGWYWKNKAGFDPSSLTGFSPQSILSLVKVEGQEELQKLQQLAQSLKGGGMTFGTITEIAGMLKEQLGKKGSRYNDGCFGSEDNPPSKQKPPKSDGKGKSTSFGEDEGQENKTDGPILACGQTNGEDSLAVFDARGALVANISKEELINNPEKILNALTKAEAAFQKFESLRSTTPQGLLKKATSTLVQKIMAPRKDDTNKKKKKKKKGEELNVVPNDPLFSGPPKKKKKKLLGILGGSSSARVGPALGNITSGGPISKSKGRFEEVFDQWGIKYVGYTPKSDPQSAWNIIDGSEKNVVVAVIDSGLDMTHPDAPKYIWTNEDEVAGNRIDDDQNGYVDDVYGWNFLDNNNDLTDYYGHGTFVTGIIAAKANNGIGIAGINPGAVIMMLKVSNGNESINNLNIYRAIRYAVDNGARVISLSLGGRGFSLLADSVVDYAHKNGVFMAIASGNKNENITEYWPASSANAFTVGAIDFSGDRSTISNWGANNGLLAPGESIYSLRSVDSFKEGTHSATSALYFTQSGTSFSTPIVAATASLMLAKNPKLTPDQIADILHQTATDMYEEGWDTKSGAGLLNARGALEASKVSDELIVKVTKIRINRKEPGKSKSKMVSVDLFGSVKSKKLDSFVVEVGKGKRAKKFKQVAGPFKKQAFNSWIARIDKDYLRGSKDWIVRIKAKDKKGSEAIAKLLLIID